MALATELTGDGTLISAEETPAIYVFDNSDGTAVYRYTNRSRTEWYALTQTAAETAVSDNTQPAQPDPGGTYTWYLECTNPIVGAYKVIRAWEKVTYV